MDKCIDDHFIPAITEGHVCSKDERKLLSLPVRLGGMGIPIFTEESIREFNTSMESTKTLRENIVAQQQTYIHNEKAQKAMAAKISPQRGKSKKKPWKIYVHV